MRAESGVRVAHLDATAGLSAAMLLGGLLDLRTGVDPDAVRAAVDDAVRSAGRAVVGTERVRRSGLGCLLATVGPVTGDGWSTRIEPVRDVLAQAGAATGDDIHDDPAEAVAAAGVLAAVEALRITELTCSAVRLGATGPGDRAPVPSAVVLDIARRAGLAVAPSDPDGPRATAVGVALLTVLATTASARPITLLAVGTGAGELDDPRRPHVLRVVLGTVDDAHRGDPAHDTVLRLRSVVDDLDPELWPSVLTALRTAGAWDCWTSPTIGRHGRPGQVVTALAAPELRTALVDVLWRHTGTLGVSWSVEERATRPRQSVTVRVGPPGDRHEIGVKVTVDDREPTVKPEWADVERVASLLGLPVRSVRLAALRAYWDDHPDGRPGATRGLA